MLSRQDQDFIQANFQKGKVVCLTGAGISAESGIPTFRGSAGLWEKYDPEIYAHAEGLISLLHEAPGKLADFIGDFYSLLLKAPPSPAHLALVAMEKEQRLSGIITQNIDNLHQYSGSRKVIELHGNAFRLRCGACAKTIILEKERLQELVELLRQSRDSRIKLLKVFSRYFWRCTCKGRFRIDIVLFGEMLPKDELSSAYAQLDNCQLLLLIGTSVVVYPAAGLPLYAKERGAKLLEINSSPTVLSYLCDRSIMGRASEILPEILRLLQHA